MLVVISALTGYALEAKDGKVGVISDFLFDDQTWEIRWLVVDTGTWLSSRKVLVHPSSIGKVDYQHEELNLALTKAQVEGSPAIAQDEPVSRQMEARLYGYYSSDPLWVGGGSYLQEGVLATPLLLLPLLGSANARGVSDAEAHSDDADPHLRSIATVKGYHMHGKDGPIGHLENVLVEDQSWAVRYFIVNTRNWWPGKHVLLSPTAVTEISWSDREIWLDVTRKAVKTSPPWKPLDMVDQVYDKQVHRHYGWPGY